MASKKYWSEWINSLSEAEIEELANSRYPVNQMPEALENKVRKDIFRHASHSAQPETVKLKHPGLIYAFGIFLLILLAATGGILFFPREAEKSVICIVRETTGTVHLYDQKGEMLRPDTGRRIKKGYTCETTDQAALGIRVGAASVIKLGSRGLLSFTSLVKKHNSELVDILLKQGAADFILEALPGGSHWTVTTASAVIQITGTEFNVRVENNDTFISVEKGEINVQPRITLPVLPQDEASPLQKLVKTIAEEELLKGYAVTTGMQAQILYGTILEIEQELAVLQEKPGRMLNVPSDTEEWKTTGEELQRIIRGIAAAALRVTPVSEEGMKILPVPEDLREPGITPVPDNRPGTGDTPGPGEAAGAVKIPSPVFTPVVRNTPAPTGTRTGTPAAREYTSQAKAVLEYITALSFDKAGKALAGQCGYQANIMDGTMTSMLNPLFKATGKWPGLLACEFEQIKICSAAELALANNVLIDYWKKGGLILVSWLPMNPWLNDEADIINNPGDANLPWNKTGVKLEDLIDPGKPVARVWQRKLDRIAAALLELKNAGVAVLWNPIAAMNSSGCWWGLESHSDDPVPAINLYRHMFDYLTKVKGLTNLLWLYTVMDYNAGIPSNVPWKAAAWCYPGDAYVDIVAANAYNDNLDIYAYNDLHKLGKPVGMVYYNPEMKPKVKGDFDNRKYIERIRSDYPAIAFWNCLTDWQSGDGTFVFCSILSNLYARELMNDPDVITREDVAW